VIDTRLICLDGLPGSGKSTTSQRLWLHLQDNGYQARWCYEHGPDTPIWRGAERFELARSDVSDSGFMRALLLSRWAEHVAELRTGEAIVLMDSSLLHTSIVVMVALSFDARSILRCLEDVADVIAPLDPVSVYLRPTDVRAAMQAVSGQRRSGEFILPLIELMAGTRYFKQHGLTGFDGVVQFFERCRDITDQTFAMLPFRKLIIDYSDQSWTSYERSITDFLALPAMPAMTGAVATPSRFVGRYKDPSSAAEVVVAADTRGLYLDDERGTRLMHHRADIFYVNAVGLELSFKDESDGAFQRLEARGDFIESNRSLVREAR
jgi:thymidylate kinase